VTIPSTMKAVVLHEYAAAAGLRIEQVPTPTPGPGQVLIEVAASPINPSDLAFIDGNYVPRPEPPTRPGLEGSGTVVAASGGAMGRYLNRRRVAFVASTKSGAWAEYVVVPQRLALPLGAQVSLQAGAMSVVNPMTALAFLDMTRSAGSRAVVNTAAAGALGRMIDRVLSSEGIEVINLVRRAEQVESLAAGGADIVLDTSSPDFDTVYKEACHEHGAGLALDAIGGTLTRRLLAGLPRGSTVVVYGGLSDQDAQVEIGDLVFAGKTVTGFWLTRWLPERNPVQILRMWRKVQRLIGDSLGSEVQATYPLEQVVDAISAYQSEMSAGKVLLTPAGQR
jgi:NADPH:quinone reductase